MPSEQKHPPIIQRTFTLFFEQKKEVFYAKQAAFGRLIAERFPEHNPRKNWSLNVKAKNGKPDFSGIKPEVHITNCYLQKDQKGETLCAVELDEDQLAINLFRTKDATHVFKDLHNAVEFCLPIFLKTFEKPKIRSLSLDYINLISRANTPAFVDAKGAIQIGNILTVFNRFPGEYESLIPPYDCQIGMALESSHGYYSAVRVSGLPEGFAGGSAIKVDLNVRRELGSRILTEPETFETLEKLHEFISNSYQNIFTEEAKKTF
jgi:uncharacterized protein (TIGR04255 family)